MELTLAQNAFQGDAPAIIELPDDWQVQFFELPGDRMNRLTARQLREKLDHPYGSPTLRELAKPGQEVCIVFDDITRGTPVQPMAEAVLEELLETGIAKNQIRFLCALGTHGAQNRQDHVHKLGEAIVRQYPVYNHNCYENNRLIGTTKKGVPVKLNAEFLQCDLRIGLGGITPHTMNGFGGGGKLLFPGIADIETVAQNHLTATEFLQKNGLDSSAMMGDLSMSGMRKEIEEMTRMAGQFFKVDCLYNSRLELIDLYAGDPIREYYAAIPRAREIYSIPPVKDQDVVIVNVNAKASEATIATGLGALGLKASGGDVVVIDLTRRGQATHYLFGAFGKFIGGRMKGGMPSVRPQVDRYICWMPWPDPGSAHWFGEEEKQVYVDTWQQALELLRQRHGPGSRVTVISDGTLACPVAAQSSLRA
jgi:nickel-dependent lactate racemase